MDIDRDVVIQVTISAGVVLLFVVGLAMLSSAYGVPTTVEDESLQGTLDGEFDNLTVADGQMDGAFQGNFENDIIAVLEGEIEGELTDDEVTGEFNGTINGAIDGTAHGTVEGTLNEDDGTFTGEFDGTASGTTSTSLSEDGGLALLALIGIFIVVMPVFGYVIERLRTEEDE